MHSLTTYNNIQRVRIFPTVNLSEYTKISNKRGCSCRRSPEVLALADSEIWEGNVWEKKVMVRGKPQTL